ncbi:hypothetical protein [Methylocystis sp.]|uniref:hypothetical protein n=1 Tax=Methylocystis sp. TaxID=1911079 RepID=UPI0027369370|nr:hypothetical protein [Methylocystis sp.]MDP3554822.1 hypothetical protein [Methylocystis sp.]
MFRDCLAAALKEGLISKKDHDRLNERYERLRADNPLGARAALASEERVRAKNARRVKLLQTRATDALYADVRRAALLRAERDQSPDLVRTAYAFFENISAEGVQSIRGTYSSLLGGAHAELSDFLRKFRRDAVTLKRFNRPLLDDVVRAGFGENVSEEAKAFYGAWRATAEKLRSLYNEAGGHIGWREDWGLPQAHDANALLNAGFDKWRGFIEPRLDWDKINVEARAPIVASERGDVLKRIFETITQDGWNSRELDGGFGETSFANRRADHRFLAFKTADDWLEYARSYGRGEPFATMMGHIKSMARDVAIMQRLGPNPAATVEWLKRLVDREAAKFVAGEPSLFGDGRGLFGWFSKGNAKLKAFQAGRTLDAFYETAKGLSAPRSPAGDTIAIARNVQYAAKLGSAVLLDLTVNPIVQAGARHLHGLPMTGVVMDALQHLKDPREIRQAGLIVDDALHTLERGAREQGALRATREFSNWLPRVTTHFSGMDALAEAQRGAAMQAIMAQTANHLDADWSALPARFKDMLKGYAITSKDWAILQKAAAHEPEKGAPFLRPRDVAALGQDAEETARRYGALLHSVAEELHPMMNWRMQAFRNRVGGHEGTAWGALVGSMLMFKSGYLATFMLTQLRMMQREWGTQGFGAMGRYAGGMTIALTFMGMVGYQLKNLVNGKDLAPIDPTTDEGRATWAKGLLTSGALGLFGDFIQSEQSSYGHGYETTIVGPMLTGALDLERAVTHPSAGGAVKFLRNNTPLLSTHWALRAAYNRLLLDQLQFMADPEAHDKMRKMESRVRRETGQGFWWRPGETTPARLPELAR